MYKDHNNILLKIGRIRSDHGRELENSLFENLCMKNGIEHEFSVPKTPQQNEVVERKNRTLQEMAQVMLKAKSVLTKIWVEVVNSTFYISNQIYQRPGTLKTSYEIWKGEKPNLKHLHKFGSLCYILNDKEPRGKFNAKSDKSVFLGYCTNSCAYRVYNKRIKIVMESVNMRVDDYPPLSETSRLEDPHVMSVLEEEKTLNSPKDAPPSNDEENK